MPWKPHRRSELKEQIQNGTNTRMTHTSANSISSVDSQMALGEAGKELGCRHQTISPCRGGSEGKEVGSGQGQKQSNEEGRSTEACLHSLISFHCLPLPRPSCLMNFPTLSSWLFSLKSRCALLPDGFFYAPVLPLCQARH